MPLCGDRNCGAAGLRLANRWWLETWLPGLPASKNRCFCLPLALFCSALWSAAAVFPGQLWAEGAGEIRAVWLAFQICLDWFKAVH